MNEENKIKIDGRNNNDNDNALKVKAAEVSAAVSPEAAIDESEVKPKAKARSKAKAKTTADGEAITPAVSEIVKDYDYAKKIAAELNVGRAQTETTLELIRDGNTIPFIARYRKEQTGNLDETVLKDIYDRYEYLLKLMSRKDEVVRSITDQGKMSDELFAKIIGCDKMQALEDIYLPYKPKKRTRGTIARELGLEPLALLIEEQKTETGTPEQYAEAYVNPASGIATAKDAISYALDIVAENISDNAEFRNVVREFYKANSLMYSIKKEKKAKKEAADKTAAETPNRDMDFLKGKKADPLDFQNYFDYKEAVSKIPPHRTLAINRGENEDILTVKIILEAENELRLSEIASKKFIKNPKSIFSAHHLEAVADALKRLVVPSITNEIRSELTVNAELHAIKIFSKNLEALLLQPPLYNRVVMGVDPGFRAGTKISVVDQSGKYLDYMTIYPHPPQNDAARASKIVAALVKKHNVELIAIGNGTASRETEAFIASTIKEEKLSVKFAIVSEAGASVYSASKVATAEFPDLDVLARGAISIARRVQDPLSELVKIDPKAIGVGEYQHDVNQKQLNESLEYVVASCVNRVGVNLNTASFMLLKHISGLNETQAVSIVKYRETNGKFTSRKALKKVPKIGDKTFEQAAGFIKVAESSNILDSTWVHPESYDAALKMIEAAGLNPAGLKGRQGLATVREAFTCIDDKKITQFAAQLSISNQLASDIAAALKKPGLDPREEMPPILLKSDVLSIGDIKTGMKLTGTVRNVVDFGAFVDIGIKNDALCHLSHCADKFIKHPLEVLKIGDVIEFTVIAIDTERGRVSLSLKKDPFAAKNFDRSVAGASGNANANDGRDKNKKPHDNRQSAKDYERNKRDDFSSVEIKFGKLR
jgi:uncharacterized protein